MNGRCTYAACIHCFIYRFLVLFVSRVNGQLAVSRAFGDFNFKFSKEESEGFGGTRSKIYTLYPTSINEEL